MKKFQILIIVVVVLFLSVSFFWFGVRPARIRHDCSWVEVYQEAIPATPAVTQEQVDADNQKCYNQCENGDSAFDCLLCKSYPDGATPAQMAQPAKDYWKKATSQQYEFCLHNKGL